MIFEQEDIRKISDILRVEPEFVGGSYIINLFNKDLNQLLFLSINNDIDYENNEESSIISVQTQYGYFELHNCTNYMIFEPDEVIFINSNEDKVSCLIISKDANCSMFSDIKRALLKTDISQLNSSVLLAAMQLSLIEKVLP
ncbi:MAG: hypothetical protein N2319_11735 [Candidatus Kapabacteria bacterium]|nr:hypothetical protein [Candidatus Kapabacteria bacterium]